MVSSEKTPGYRGDAPIGELLKYLGADNDSSNKNKKKNKTKRDDIKLDDKECKKKTHKSDEHNAEKSHGVDDDQFDNKMWEEGSSGSGSDPPSTKLKFNGKDDSSKSKYGNDKNKKMKIKDQRSKRSFGTLRESSSMEDLVSKSKQSDNSVRVRKQVTVDDGEMTLGAVDTYQYVQSSESSCRISHSQRNNSSSEFERDFYNSGDPFLESDPGSSINASNGGEFELVNRRRSRRNKSTGSSQPVSQGTKFGGSAGYMNSTSWGNNNHSSSYLYDDFRFGAKNSSNRFPCINGSNDRPHINFTEGPRTVHDGMFLARWSQGGVDRYCNSDRYTTTTSAPHSEDSDSDGGDSVHSMPANSITPRPNVRKPPPSTDSTPQASYANIAKLAANANRAQMKRIGSQSSSSGTDQLSGKSNKEDSPVDDEISDQIDAKCSENKKNTILDDNFPSLAESVNVSGSHNFGNQPSKGTNDSGIASVGDNTIATLSPISNISCSNCGSISTNTGDSFKKIDVEIKPRTISCSSVKGDLSDSSLTKTMNDSLYNSSLDNKSTVSLSPPQLINISHESSPPYLDHSSLVNKKSKNVNISSPILHSTPQFSQPPPPIHNSITIDTSKPPPPLPMHVKPPHLPRLTSPPNVHPSHASTIYSTSSDNQVNSAAHVNSNEIKSITVSKTGPPPRIQNNTTNINVNNGNNNNTSGGVTILENNNNNNGNNNRIRKIEPAVVFTGTENVKFGHTVTDIEFGFDFSLAETNVCNDNRKELAPAFEMNGVEKFNNNNNCNNNYNNSNNNNNNSSKTKNSKNNSKSNSVNIKNTKNIAKDFSKMFQPPKNDEIKFNYEDLIKHFTKCK